MKRFAAVLTSIVALSVSACGEITGFCMTAGAPSGLKLVVTTTPQGIKCSYQIPVDTVPRPTPNKPQ